MEMRVEEGVEQEKKVKRKEVEEVREKCWREVKKKEGSQRSRTSMSDGERADTLRGEDENGVRRKEKLCSLTEYKRQGTKARDAKVWERGNGGRVRQADINTDTDTQILAERERETLVMQLSLTCTHKLNTQALYTH